MWIYEVTWGIPGYSYINVTAMAGWLGRFRFLFLPRSCLDLCLFLLLRLRHLRLLRPLSLRLRVRRCRHLLHLPVRPLPHLRYHLCPRPQYPLHLPPRLPESFSLVER